MATTNPVKPRRSLNERAFLATRYTNVSLETTVKGGFPVIVVGHVEPPDRSVGYNNPYLCDVAVYTQDWHSADFLKLSKQEMERVKDELWRATCD